MTKPPVESRTVARLDEAIAQLEATVREMGEQPRGATASADGVSITLDSQGLLVSAELSASAVHRGLTALGDEILELQQRALDALSTGVAQDGVRLEEGVELDGGAPAPRRALVPRSRAPQLPPLPSQTDVDLLVAQLEAHFAHAASGTDASVQSRFGSEYVDVRVDQTGILTDVHFREAALGADPNMLGDDLVATTAAAREQTESTED